MPVCRKPPCLAQLLLATCVATAPSALGQASSLVSAGVTTPSDVSSPPIDTPAFDAPSTTRQAFLSSSSSSSSTNLEDTAHNSAADARSRIRAQAELEVKLEETQRILAVVPNFNTVLSGRAAPLDARQKTELAWHATIDPFNLVGAFVLAGASEVQGTHRGFGWGPAGYSKRVGVNLADVVDGTMLAGAVYPIVLHQDPRFFRQGTGPIPSRLRHALLAPFICRGDNGNPQPNFSNILGNFTAGAISNAYYPAQDRGASLTLINSSIVTLEGSLGNIGLEFAPDVQAFMHHRKMNRLASSTAN